MFINGRGHCVWEIDDGTISGMRGVGAREDDSASQKRREEETTKGTERWRKEKALV